MAKKERMARLRAAAEAVRERVCDPRVSLVWGEGDLDSPLAIVGEAPGAREDELRRPFVGPSGGLLSRELHLAGIDREHCYITGAVKCRPIRPGTSANRSPTKQEVEAWRSILLSQLEIIAPKVILCLGATAASVLIHARFSMTEERGQWFEGPNGIRTMATYHPAYIMRFARSLDDPRLRGFRADLKAIADALSQFRPTCSSG